MNNEIDFLQTLKDHKYKIEKLKTEINIDTFQPEIPIKIYFPIEESTDACYQHDIDVIFETIGESIKQQLIEFIKTW